MSVPGLVLTGGGARGAYQVGVLRGLLRARPELDFPVLAGVSAGAINIAVMASRPAPLALAVEELARLWASLTVEQVFEARFLPMWANALKWGARLTSGGSGLAPATRGLVDTAPLARLLARTLDTAPGEPIPGIGTNVAAGRVRAVALSTTNYATGQSVTFCETREEVDLWQRPLRKAVREKLTLEHVLASSALPLFFPAVRLGRDWHGDGGIRQTAPLSPALHLGADRILAVSTRHLRALDEAGIAGAEPYPPPAQVLGLLMSAVFLDVLDQDARQMARVNHLIERVSPEERAGLRRVDVRIVRPSQDLAALARAYEPRLPGTFRFLTRGLGTREASSPEALSMLLFEPGYLTHVMSIGEADGHARAAELAAFLRGGTAAHAAPEVS